MDKAQAHQLLKEVLAEAWRNEPRGILGSRLKAALLTAAHKRGDEFDEKALGYDGFGSFLADSKVAALKFRPRTDVLVAPIEHADALERTNKENAARPHVRSDFWDAFVGFEIAGQKRAYDRASDVVLVNPPSVIPESAVPIRPISRETQIVWRGEFIDTLGPDSPVTQVKSALDQHGGLRAFSVAVTAQPELRERWTDFFLHKVIDVIRSWSLANGIPVDAWLETASQQPVLGHARGSRTSSMSRDRDETMRLRIYRALDTFPVERLLRLKIPIEWLIDSRRDR